jgi:hypothetical protein
VGQGVPPPDSAPCARTATAATTVTTGRACQKAASKYDLGRKSKVEPREGMNGGDLGMTVVTKRQVGPLAAQWFARVEEATMPLNIDGQDVIATLSDCGKMTSKRDVGAEPRPHGTPRPGRTRARVCGPPGSP